MRSLDEMNAKLDTLAENDGKLLAALNELDANVENCLGEILELATKPRVKPKRKKRAAKAKK